MISWIALGKVITCVVSCAQRYQYFYIHTFGLGQAIAFYTTVVNSELLKIAKILKLLKLILKIVKIVEY